MHTRSRRPLASSSSTRISYLLCFLVLSSLYTAYSSQIFPSTRSWLGTSPNPCSPSATLTSGPCSSFSSCVGQFVLTASLRSQVNPANSEEFKEVSPERHAFQLFSARSPI